MLNSRSWRPKCLTLLIVVSSFEAILRSRPFDILTAPATYFALTHQLHIDESGPFDRTSASRNSPLCHKLQTQKVVSSAPQE